MRWQFWQRPTPRQLPEEVKQALLEQFSINAASVGQLRCYTRIGSFANRRVEYIWIFDPDLVEEGEPAPTGYDAFALIDPRRSALLFEGRRDGADIYLTDRRSRQKQQRCPDPD